MNERPFTYSIPKRILLPVDFSPSSDAALIVATDFAQHLEAKLYLLNVVPLIPIEPSGEIFSSTISFPEPTFLSDSKRLAEERLETCVASLLSSGLEATFNVEVSNDIVSEITSLVKREQIELVVLSTHGVSGWRPLVFGSIAQQVIKLVTCPLLLLRSVNPSVTSSAQD